MLSYPDFLEKWWINEAMQRLRFRSEEACLGRLSPEVENLSQTFTALREGGFSQYLDNAHSVLAYGLYYFPQTFVRTSYVLSELLDFQRWRPSTHEQLHILDLGSGLGAASFSALEALAGRECLAQGASLEAVDQSHLKLELFRMLSKEYAGRMPNVRWTATQGSLEKTETWKNPRGQKRDLILISFSIGEVFYARPDEEVLAWLNGVLDMLSPEGLCVIIEPALRETATRLQRLRNALTADNSRRILAPCLHQGLCPLLHPGEKPGKEKHWCHEVRKWPVPLYVQKLNQKLKRPRTVNPLKFSFLALGTQSLEHGNNGHAGGAETFRMVSPLIKTAGKFQMSGCAADGNLNRYDLLTRSFKAKDKKEIREVERGDIIHLHQCEPLKGERSYRIPAKDDLKILFHAE